MTDTPLLRASDFINSIGVNAHIDQTSSSYATSNVVGQMAFLGIDNMRSETPFDNIVLYETLGAAGIKLDLVPVIAHQNPASLAIEMALINSVAPFVVSVEGPNEVNTDPISYNGLSGAAAADAFQKDLYNAVHSDPLLHGVSVLPFSLSVGGSLAGYGNVAANADYGNVHGYASDGVPPYYMLSYAVSSVTTTPGKQPIMTETGNYTDFDGQSGVPQDVQAKWMVDTLLENSANNVLKTYIYQLEDEGTDQPGAAPFSENHYGLFNSDGTPKLAAVAIHNLTTILADTGSKAATFTPGSLNYSVTGLPQWNGFQNIYAKSNGSFDIALWYEPQFYNAATGVEAPVAPAPVTITLGGGTYNVSVFDPITGSAAISNQTNVTSVQVTLTTDPLIVQVTPIANLSSAPGQGIIDGTVHHFGPKDPIWGSAQSNVAVSLLNSTGNVIAKTVSDRDGWFDFTHLAAGSYALGYTPPAGEALASGSAANTSTGVTALFKVAANGTVWTRTEGVVSTSTAPALTGARTMVAAANTPAISHTNVSMGTPPTPAFIAATGAVTLDAGTAPNPQTLTGGTGRTAFLLHARAANGDTITNFTTSDFLELTGYGNGATLTQFSANTWQASSRLGSVHDLIHFTTPPNLQPENFLFK